MTCLLFGLNRSLFVLVILYNTYPANTTMKILKKNGNFGVSMIIKQHCHGNQNKKDLNFVDSDTVVATVSFYNRYRNTVPITIVNVY